MNAEQYAVYQAVTASPTAINIRDLDDGEYTLAYGYTCDRDTWHAYTHGDQIHVLLYRGSGTVRPSELLGHRHGAALPVEVLRPNKRVYPDTVNETFARLMFDAGAELPFIGNFDFSSVDAVRRQGKGPFKGKTHLDF